MTAHLTAPPPRGQRRAARPAGRPSTRCWPGPWRRTRPPGSRRCTEFVAALAAAPGARRPRPRPPGADRPRCPTRCCGPAVARLRRAARGPWHLRVGLGRRGRVRCGLRLGQGRSPCGATPAALAGVAPLAPGPGRGPARRSGISAWSAPSPPYRARTGCGCNWLPHARPATPPLSGPHVATNPEAAADLVHRLGDGGRRCDRDPTPPWPPWSRGAGRAARCPGRPVRPGRPGGGTCRVRAAATDLRSRPGCPLWTWRPPGLGRPTVATVAYVRATSAALDSGTESRPRGGGRRGAGAAVRGGRVAVAR